MLDFKEVKIIKVSMSQIYLAPHTILQWLLRPSFTLKIAFHGQKMQTKKLSLIVTP